MAFTERDKKNLQVGLFLAVVVAAVVLYVHFVFLSRANTQDKNKIEQIQNEMPELSDRLNDMKLMVSKDGEIREQQTLIQDIKKRLPSDPQETEFYTLLINMLKTSGVKNKRVRPDEIHPTALYTEIPYIVEGFARYHNLGEFMNLVEINSKRFMRISGFLIENADEHPSRHPVKIKISTFTFNEP